MLLKLPCARFSPVPRAAASPIMKASAPFLALFLSAVLAGPLSVATGGGGGGGPLLPCGSSGGADPGGDSHEVIDVFDFAKGVCEQRGESFPAGAPLPTSCASAECQRAVQLAADSCEAAFAKGGFLKTAFGPVLHAAAVVCAAAPRAANGQVRSQRASLLCVPLLHCLSLGG
eukprot:COSAG06_NODE_6625_length_2850_cov_1410.579426_2_plen_173_part_00